MQRILKNNISFFIKKIYLLLDFINKYLFFIVNIIIILNLFIFSNIYMNKFNIKLKFNYFKINKINLNNLFNKKFNLYLKSKNKFNKIKFEFIDLNKNIYYLKNKNKFNNKKTYFLITYIKINNNFIKNLMNLGLKKNDINNIKNIVNKFINIKNLTKDSKFIIFSIFNESNKFKIDINKLICIKVINKNKKIYIYKKLNDKYYIFNINNKFMKFPTKKRFKITSKFNLNRLNPITNKIYPHKGIDIAMPIGTPILSVSNGIIKDISKDNISGNYIVIKHNNRCITKYMHLKKCIVKKGQKINLGQCIGYSGNSGRSTGPHLHFEIWINSNAVNPLTIELNKKYYNMLYINDIRKLIYNIELNISKNILI
ncbi:peptidoglycan DD-metalloendopeptidase family protein [endosymbiont of Pachyrhynchus infernalis]|uniref:peptidoglycan DD-metalloendopeptidase family protein n=1 Tax=endosymbiont of Pachyrhynchus infernalis TaxID=1971488 RepID=UPI000DC72EEC|nr:peptidoglycan DD-metalloendopeptidase family protein [endosymbiont of Pachyrhynchus infernalis]BBA84789.1 cell wall endopeptidase family M23/M37 [endosymbiont of Pachyrhynchus infernalis]